MGIGGSIFLIAVGAILAFAVNTTVSGLDLQVVGWILMGAGVLGLALFLLVFGPRSRTAVTTQSVYRDPNRDPNYRDPNYRDPDAPVRETYRRDTY